MGPPAHRPTVLFDTNVILDVLLERHPFFEEANHLWQKCDEGALDAHVSAVSITTIFYVARKLKGLEKAREAVVVTLRAFQVISVHRETLEAARQMPGPDFEDNVQIACARAASVEHIVTRDADGFAASPIAAIAPREILRLLATYQQG